MKKAEHAEYRDRKRRRDEARRAKFAEEVRRSSQSASGTETAVDEQTGVQEAAVLAQVQEELSAEQPETVQQGIPVKQTWRPGNMLYPLPAVLVSVADAEGHDNLLTIAWAGTVCSDPACVSISVRKSRYSHHMIEETGEFVINLTTEELVYATDYCGVRTGRDLDKWKACGLTRIEADKVKVPMVAESPVNIECRVISQTELGSHDMFVAEVLAVHADERYMNKEGRFELDKAHPIVYSHGTYFGLGDALGTFGYSVKKK